MLSRIRLADAGPALNDARILGATEIVHFFFLFFSSVRLRNFSGRNIWFPELAM
jgi:hypothetical protein